MNGILVRASRTIPAGSSVQVSMELAPRMKPLTGSGSVARIAGANQMGIHFDNLSLGESERLQEFLLPMIPPE